MEKMFDIDSSYSSHRDEVLELIEETAKRKFDVNSGLFFINLKSYQEENSYYIDKAIRDTKDSWGALDFDLFKIPQELDTLLMEFKNFYLTKSDLKGFSPQEINYIIHKTYVRLKRLLCVVDPNYSVIEFEDKKSTNHLKYKMIKGYWINDAGERVRSLSKNIGNIEATINELTEKLLKSNITNSVFYAPENMFGPKPDLIMSDGKTQWAVETKMLNMENFIKIFVILEMWKLYKKEYKLLV